MNEYNKLKITPEFSRDTKIAKKNMPKILSEVMSGYKNKIYEKDVEKMIRTSEDPTIKEFRKNMSYRDMGQDELKKFVHAFQEEHGIETTKDVQGRLDRALQSRMPTPAQPENVTAPKPQGRNILSRIFGKPTMSNNSSRGGSLARPSSLSSQPTPPPTSQSAQRISLAQSPKMPNIPSMKK